MIWNWYNIALLSVLLLCLAGCGKKGALLYPDQLVPAAPSSLAARQAGPSIKLSFALPQKDRAGRRLKDLSGVRILRREAVAGTSPACSECVSDFNLFRLLYLDTLGDAERYGNLLLLLDGTVKAGREYTYKVVPFTRDIIDGEASALVLTRVIEPVLPPVLQLVAEPTEIRLEFISALPMVGRLDGYNLYRAPKGERLPLLPVNNEPLKANRYQDTALDRKTSYTYAVRSVVRMPSGELIESVSSNEAEGALKENE